MRRVIVNSTPLIALCNADLLNISLKILYIIFDYSHKHYTFKQFEV